MDNTKDEETKKTVTKKHQTVPLAPIYFPHRRNGTRLNFAA
jgi:hypothetical protein